jgi:hypothetical protein
MAVTINDMQVDVEDRAAGGKASAEAPKPNETVSLRCRMERLAERQLRLKAD